MKPKEKNESFSESKVDTNIYFIDPNYLAFIKMIDDHVKTKSTRPYILVPIRDSEYMYAIPVTSKILGSNYYGRNLPKPQEVCEYLNQNKKTDKQQKEEETKPYYERHLDLSNAIGCLLVGAMIPVTKDLVQKISERERNDKYRELALYCKTHEEKLRDAEQKANRLYEIPVWAMDPKNNIPRVYEAWCVNYRVAESALQTFLRAQKEDRETGKNHFAKIPAEEKYMNEVVKTAFETIRKIKGLEDYRPFNTQELRVKRIERMENRKKNKSYSQPLSTSIGDILKNSGIKI